MILSVAEPVLAGRLPTRIPARIVDKATGRIWNISENLHRVELTRLERDEAIVQYAKARKRQDGQVAHPLRGGTHAINCECKICRNRQNRWKGDFSNW
jgi:hypothetical protein